MPLVAITPDRVDVDLSLAYATAVNFTGQPIYAEADCYLHADAAALLDRATGLAAALGYRFRIFDAFRPSEAQWAMWRHTPDPVFLSDPRCGSPHSRGVAVDLTLVDTAGRTLDMGTGFDAFTPLSHHGNDAIPPSAQRNRALLLGIMTAAGWDCYLKEWWHYQLFEPRRYPLLSDSVLPRPMMTAPTARTTGTAGRLAAPTGER
ncbi:MAG: D-alanyl-D-alanine dipeptidase [Alphaproteobacteria bacterium]